MISSCTSSTISSYFFFSSGISSSLISISSINSSGRGFSQTEHLAEEASLIRVHAEQAHWEETFFFGDYFSVSWTFEYLLRIKSTAVSSEAFLHSIKAFLDILSLKPIEERVLRRLLSGTISLIFGVYFSFSLFFSFLTSSYFFSCNCLSNFSGGLTLSAYFRQFLRIL